jgi:monoamine oxidase
MSEKKKSAIIIGSGFGGLGSAAILAKAGWDVTVLEKNEMVGGRATVFEARKQKNGTYKRFDSLSENLNVTPKAASSDKVQADNTATRANDGLGLIEGQAGT